MIGFSGKPISIETWKARAALNDPKAIAFLAELQAKETRAWNRRCELHWFLVGLFNFLMPIVQVIIGIALGTVIFFLCLTPFIKHC